MASPKCGSVDLSPPCDETDVNAPACEASHIYQEISLDPSETVEINLCGAQITNSTPNDPSSPFIVSNQKLGGFSLDTTCHTLKPNGHIWDTDPRKRFVPNEILAGVHQLQNFLRRAHDVMSTHAPVCAERLHDRVLQTRQKLNKHLNSSTIVTAMMEDLNAKVSALVRAVSVSEYVHNNIRDVTACVGAFDGHMAFLRKLAEDMKTEYVLFTRNFNPMSCSVHEQLMRTFQHIHNTVVALYGRMENLNTLVEQLKVKHEMFKSKRRAI